MTTERGIAMPMALMVTMLLTALIAAFAVLATSERQIASNHSASAQARALAESGVERVLWALSTGETSPSAPGAIVLNASYDLPSPLPPPYDGSTEVAQGAGSFKVTVAPGAQINEKVVSAVGFVPNATNPKAIRKIQAVATRIKWIDPLCGLCAGGENPPGTSIDVEVGGSATVNASTSAQRNGGQTVAAGAFCAGVTPTAAVSSTGTVNTNGTPNLDAPPGGVDTQNGASFPGTMILTNSDMETLRAMARALGPTHYYRGSQNWTSPPPNGIVFVDTVSGDPLTDASPPSDVPKVRIHGNWSHGWSGWLVVAGSIDLSGDLTMSGLIYAQNDVTLHGTGNGSYTGAIISTNRVNTTTSNIHSPHIGNGPISYDCPAVRSGGGQLSQQWFIKPGTYRELSGSSGPVAGQKIP
jgi:hypothetical protein